MIKSAEIQVRFSDLDVLGHVNNSVYLSYFETARVHYFGELLGHNWDWINHGVLLVKNEVEYLKPVLLNDQPQIIISLGKLGTKSFQLTYLLKVRGEVYSKGSSVLVTFDSTQKQTIPIPEKMKLALERLRTEQ